MMLFIPCVKSLGFIRVQSSGFSQPNAPAKLRGLRPFVGQPSASAGCWTAIKLICCLTVLSLYDQAHTSQTHHNISPCVLQLSLFYLQFRMLLTLTLQSLE